MKKFKNQKPKVQHDTWGHHETMLINLRDWVRRELEFLDRDLREELPTMASSTSTQKLLKNAEESSAQLFDTIRLIVDRAESEAAKSKKKSTVSHESPDEFSAID